MSSQRYPEEFKTEAVKQILDHGHRVADVSNRLGVSTHSLYKWMPERQMPLSARTLDMRDLGERCSKHRGAKLLKHEGLQAQRGYRRRPSPRGAQPAVVAPNVLEQQFSVQMPNQAWVTDITYVRTHEGWLYLSVVIDLFSRQVLGWSMGNRVDTQADGRLAAQAQQDGAGSFRPGLPIH